MGTKMQQIEKGIDVGNSSRKFRKRAKKERNRLIRRKAKNLESAPEIKKYKDYEW